jgi:hypothetical protein
VGWVAKLHRGGVTESVLIEAKANTVEFVTPPGSASKLGGRGQIEMTLGRLKAYLGGIVFFPWLGTYYQYANRLAVLYFLVSQVGVPTHLLHVYFMGDRFPDGSEYPAKRRSLAPFD